MSCTLNKVQYASKQGFSWRDLIRELDRNTQNACGNCTVPAAAIITYRRSATPERPWKSWNYRGGELYNSCSVKRERSSLIVCILISINSQDTEQSLYQMFCPTGGRQNNINTSQRRNEGSGGGGLKATYSTRQPFYGLSAVSLFLLAELRTCLLSNNALCWIGLDIGFFFAPIYLNCAHKSPLRINKAMLGGCLTNTLLFLHFCLKIDVQLIHMYEPYFRVSDFSFLKKEEMQRCLNINDNVTTLLLLALRLGSFLRVRGQFVASIPLSLRCSAARRGITPPPTLEKLQRATEKQSERSLSNSNSWAGMGAPAWRQYINSWWD